MLLLMLSHPLRFILLLFLLAVLKKKKRDGAFSPVISSTHRTAGECRAERTERTSMRAFLRRATVFNFT